MRNEPIQVLRAASRSPAADPAAPELVWRASQGNLQALVAAWLGR